MVFKNLRYMEKVAYDVIVSYPLPPENHVWGEAKNHATGNFIHLLSLFCIIFIIKYNRLYLTVFINSFS